VDAVNSRITLAKESATEKVDQLDSKCEEIEKEVCGRLSYFGSMCGLKILIPYLASKFQIGAIPHNRKMEIRTEIQSCSMSVATFT
jgi:hypothetical protein